MSGGLPAVAGQLGATYAIPVIYVPTLMITHFAAFYLLLRPQPKAARTLAGEAAKGRNHQNVRALQPDL